MKFTSQKIFYILTCITCIILFIYILYTICNFFTSSRLNNYSNNKFEDTPPSTSDSTEPIVTTMVVPTDDLQTCTANNNIVGFCMNYTGCCDQKTSDNNRCFCGHTIVQDCNNTYEECKKTSSNSEDCKSKLKDCCISYNKINIDSSNFEKPIKQLQTSQKLCSIGSINGLSTDSMREKCMELCQTNTDCKAFSIDNVNCALFNGVNPLPTKPSYKPQPKTDYYIKK